MEFREITELQNFEKFKRIKLNSIKFKIIQGNSSEIKEIQVYLSDCSKFDAIKYYSSKCNGI